MLMSVAVPDEGTKTTGIHLRFSALSPNIHSVDNITLDHI